MAILDENKIRAIVQEEIRRSDSAGRFGLKNIPHHTHNGIDSLAIKAESITASTSVTGIVTMDEETVYTVNLNASFTPSKIQAYGVITGSYLGNQSRILTVGSAQLTPTFYLEDNEREDGTYRTVINTQNIQFPVGTKPAQTSSYLNVTRGGTANFFAGAGRDNIVDVVFPDVTSEDDIRARVTVIDFSRNFIKFDVPYLDSGWRIFLTLVIT